MKEKHLGWWVDWLLYGRKWAETGFELFPHGSEKLRLSPSSDTKVFDLAPVVFPFGRMFVLLWDWHCAEIFYYHKEATKKMIIQKRIENWANFSKSSTLAI